MKPGISLQVVTKRGRIESTRDSNAIETRVKENGSGYRSNRKKMECVVLSSLIGILPRYEEGER
jgi:hypothetical protein